MMNTGDEQEQIRGYCFTMLNHNQVFTVSFMSFTSYYTSACHQLKTAALTLSVVNLCVAA